MVKATEIRVWLQEGMVKKIDKDITFRGKSRSEVVGSIVEDYYLGNLINVKGLEKMLRKTGEK